MNKRSIIIGCGSYLPENIVTNTDLEKIMDTSNEWIIERTGIKERRHIKKGDGNSTASMGIEAAKIANANEFIHKIENNFNSNVGDGGGKLSGGQKQRISIARAVLNNPPIMILDEATSSLDSESEKLVQDALENLMKNRTSIIIAHRLSTIQNANLILVMKEGEIIEKGIATGKSTSYLNTNFQLTESRSLRSAAEKVAITLTSKLSEGY